MKDLSTNVHVSLTKRKLYSYYRIPLIYLIFLKKPFSIKNNFSSCFKMLMMSVDLFTRLVTLELTLKRLTVFWKFTFIFFSIVMQCGSIGKYCRNNLSFLLTSIWAVCLPKKMRDYSN